MYLHSVSSQVFLTMLVASFLGNLDPLHSAAVVAAIVCVLARVRLRAGAPTVGSPGGQLGGNNGGTN